MTDIRYIYDNETLDDFLCWTDADGECDPIALCQLEVPLDSGETFLATPFLPVSEDSIIRVLLNSGRAYDYERVQVTEPTDRTYWKRVA